MTKLTRKQATNHQAILRLRGIYKPYVSTDGDSLVIESYPLTARLTPGFDPAHGPITNITVTDCSLQRIGQEHRVAQVVALFMQPFEQVLCPILLALHPEAYARAKAQDATACEVAR